MRTLRPLMVAAVLAVSSFASSAFAWNDAGHMTSAKLAWDRMSPDSRKAVGALLAQHPHYDSLLINDLPDGVDKSEWAFIKAASWPDAVRPPSRAFPTYKPPSVTKFHRASWHYKDLPYSPDDSFKMPAEPATQTTGGDAEPADALAALDYNRKILADASKPAADRAVALCWVEHLVGDIHQPLHACTMYSKDYPKGDAGGNSQTVVTDGTIQNLHTIWDNALGTASNYEAVSILARDMELDPRCDVAKLKEYGEHKSAEGWFDESHRAAIAFVYLDGKLKTLSSSAANRPTTQPNDPPALPSQYLINANVVCRQRDALAGARMADAVAGLVK